MSEFPRSVLPVGMKERKIAVNERRGAMTLNITPDWLKSLVHTPNIYTNIKLFGGHQQTVPYLWKAERETHFAFEINYVLSGTQRTILNGTSYDFTVGDLILIFPGLAHENQCISKEGMTYFCIHFDIDDPIIQQKLLMYCPLFLNKNNQAYPQLLAVLESYIEILNVGNFDLKEKLNIQKLMIELIIHLLDYAEHAEQNVKKSNNATLLLATEIAASLQENFRQFRKAPIDANRGYLSLHQIAESLGISESTMLKEFKKVYSVSPKHYLDQLRYNEAKALLIQPSLSISDISDVIGYQNVSHFSRQFKNWSGQSPKQYRQENKI